MLDTTYKIATPEGVELKLPVAGLGARSLAWLIDASIKVFVLFVAGMIVGVAGRTGAGLNLILAFLMLWFYNVLFEVLYNGATPGKRVLGLRVMNINGTPVGWTGSLIRNLIRFVDSLPGCYAFGCVSVLVSRHFQRLGDLAAGTIVVHQPRRERASRIAEADVRAIDVPLSAEEQQAIVGFAERVPRLNQERAEELAGILRPIFPEASAARLQAYANHIAGSAHSR